MCTSVAMRTESFYFGRNMDIDYSFGERVAIAPRNYSLSFRKTTAMDKHYAIIGMAAVAENYPLYADGMNENGLCMAGLKFTGNAVYSETITAGKTGIAPYELIPWILGRCRTVSEARTLLNETCIINEPFSAELPLSPLHWHIADKNSSIVVENTADGMKIYDNPADVLTNNPPFPFHLANLSQYARLSPDFSPENSIAEPFGLGFGAIGLPGDFSPASRFVRAEFLLRSLPSDSGINDFFHILDNAAIPRGAVITPDKKLHFTTYSCCMDTSEAVYFYKLYNGQTKGIALSSPRINDNSLMEFTLSDNHTFLTE